MRGSATIATLPTQTSEQFDKAVEWLNAATRVALPILPTGIEVAEVLRALGADEQVLVASVLSDPGISDPWSLEAIGKEFGSVVQILVSNVRELNRFQTAPDHQLEVPEQAERARRLLLAIIDDVRSVVIKLGYRLIRLRKLSHESEEEQRRLARESLEIFAPLANRLGVAQLKWEIEDLSFRYVQPDTYKTIARQLEDKRADRETYLADFMQSLRSMLSESGVEANVSGRPKHIYSIWKKLSKKNLSFDELYDLRALRVIVPNLADCYAVLGIVHTHWHTIPQEFDDYIANPKPNGYQSLHTVVVGPRDKPIEIQIRTQQMHDYAELGFAAHWRYKENSGQDDALGNAINSLRGLLEGEPKDLEGHEKSFQAEIFPDRVFVLTPKGEVMELGKGATPLDFAYAIHTEIGHRCRGAKVNGHIVSLSYQLQTGEKVEVLTGKNPAPSRDWMNAGSGYLNSSNSRSKVRNWWHQQDQRENLENGRRLLEQAKKRWNNNLVTLAELLTRFSQADEDSLLVAIGRGDIRSAQLDALLRPPPDEKPKKSKIPEVPASRQDAAATVLGVGNLLSRVAQCCKPVPGDDVVGYITQGHGITVHRRDCKNMLHLPEERLERLVEIQWGQQRGAYPVNIKISALDRSGLLRDITQEMSARKINVIRSETYTDIETEQVKMKLSIQIRDNEQLEQLMAQLRTIKSVLNVKRAH